MTDTKWGQIAGELRQQILKGEFPPGSMLPSIPELMDKYDAARDTIRDAISRLTHEGLVTPRRGIGTVVRERLAIDLAYRPELPVQTWAAQTAGESDTIVDSRWETADQEIADRLQIDKDDEVFFRSRRQTKGGQTARLHDQWMPAKLAKLVNSKTKANLEAEVGNLFELLKAVKSAPTSVTETISARMPTPEETELLGLAPGIPVIISHRISRDQSGKPVETSTMTGAADRVTQSFTVPITQ